MNTEQNIENNIQWLLMSDIRVKDGEDQGALYGWKDLTNASLPFIYSEIVGYAITCFSWIYLETSNKQALTSAQEGSQWIQKNIQQDLLPAGKIGNNKSFESKGNLHNQIYSFDNGMIITGLLNLYNSDSNSDHLKVASRIADGLIEKFWDGDHMTALLNSSFNHTDYGKGKWSTIPGPYHTKIAIGFLKLFNATGNQLYRDIARSLCDFGLKKQDPNGRFKTNIENDITFMHPHLYSCEGLLYAGIELMEEQYIESSLNGLGWAVKVMNENKCSLPRSTDENIEQSDCIAQLLRLLIICRSKLKKNQSLNVEAAIENLKKSLLNLYVSDGKDMGGYRYQSSFNQVCTWYICSHYRHRVFTI